MLYGIRLVSCCETRDIVLDDAMCLGFQMSGLASKCGRTSISETFPASSRTATVQTNSASHFGKRAHVRGGKLKKKMKRKSKELGSDPLTILVDASPSLFFFYIISLFSFLSRRILILDRNVQYALCTHERHNVTPRLLIPVTKTRRPKARAY